MLTGEVGTGKTTLINKLLEWLHKEASFNRVCLPIPRLQRLAVLRFHDGRLSAFPMNRGKKARCSSS